jgi:biopolymer transport protein ExbD
MEPINIMPLMNIIMLLIPFLIMSMEFIKIGTIHVTAPKLGAGRSSSDEAKKKPEKPPLNLTISVTDKGLTLITRGNKIPRGCDLSPAAMKATDKRLPTIKKDGKTYNFTSLRACLSKIKNLFSHEKRVIIMAEPEIPYKFIVSIMDSSRSSKKFPRECQEQQGIVACKSGKDGMFPQVVLSAGVI